MSSFLPSNLISRVRHELRHQGLMATIRKAAQRAREKLYLDVTHVWYELPLEADRPQVALPPGLMLIRGGASDLPLLDELPSVHMWLARRRMEAGDDFWLVFSERPVFVCWVLHRSAQSAVPGGQLALPPGIVCFEDSVTSTSYRGRGMLGPAAWSQIADRLEKTGAKSIITKVEADNRVMRLAIVKSGFRETAISRFRRLGLRQQTTVTGTGPVFDWLAEQLRH